MYYGYWSVLYFRRALAGRAADLDCFTDIGAYKLCDATQGLSIYSSLVLLMTQALLSRMFFPGVSNFVNASVSCLLLVRV